MDPRLDDYSDLVELGIDIDESDVLGNKFNKCVKYIQGIAGTLNNEVLLKLYGFYKQSIEGPCNIPKPSWYDMKGKSKWEAWNNLGDMSSDDAKNKYIQTVLDVSPSFNFEDTQMKTDSWVKVSSLAHEPVSNTDICDFIQSGDEKKVKEYLAGDTNHKNALDDQGMGLIHYASDIGNLNILKMLVEDGYDFNLQDKDKQTPLHYAASCGHEDCVKFLLSCGALIDIVDVDGCKAVDVACDSVKRLLKPT
ncbi:acyl-CoA-binding domain-containing protein 6-like [Rhynchophorus ferrugineus]|uniref:acyl-CoA-binding domain-containing protein 6-like n=1 Tax=Rhynchophorus ferrugineus TaxID=354439 RepID=UPI003FCD7FF3